MRKTSISTLKSVKVCRTLFYLFLIIKIVSVSFLGIYFIWNTKTLDISPDVEKISKVFPSNNNFEIRKDPSDLMQQEQSIESSEKQITLEEEFRKNPDCPIDKFYAFREWQLKESHLPKLSDERLFQFFFSCYYDIEGSKKCIQSFLDIKSSSPEFFCNRDISDPTLQKALSNNTIFTMPVLTPNKQYRITFLRVDTPDPSQFDFPNIVKLFFMAYDAELHVNGTAKGHIIVFDFKNCGLRHIMKTSLDTWKKLIRLTQEGLPVRRKTLHILNTNYFIYKFCQVLKPFIAPAVFKTIILHRPNDLKDFYEDIPKECLPSDYGGDLESADILKKKFEEDLWKLRDFFNQDDHEIICKNKNT